MALPDITSNLELHYKCDDEIDSLIIKDSGLKGHDLTIVRDLTIDGNPRPRRVIADGRKAWSFSRAKTTGTGANVSNYAKKVITDVQMDALVGSGNGHNGEHTIAAWIRKSPAGIGEGTGSEFILSIGGNGVLADGAQNNAQATTLRQGRSVGSLKKYDIFFLKTPNTVGTFTPAFVPSAKFESKWVHVAFVIRADVANTSCFIDFYKNGLLIETSASMPASYAFTGALPATAAILMSGLTGNTDFTAVGQVGGELRNVMLFSRALTAGDMAALFASTLVAPPADFDSAIR